MLNEVDPAVSKKATTITQMTIALQDWLVSKNH